MSGSSRAAALSANAERVFVALARVASHVFHLVTADVERRPVNLRFVSRYHAVHERAKE